MLNYGHVYIMEFKNGCKIGQTAKDLKIRFSPFKQPWCRDIKSIYVSKVDTKKLRFFESLIINKLENYQGFFRYRTSEFFPHGSNVIRKETKKLLKWVKYE
jgi:hypothetical protein